MPPSSPALPDTLAAAPRRLPPRHDGLTRTQHRAVVVAIAAAHVAAIYGALQVPAVRASVLEAAPIFVNLLAPPEPEAPPPPPTTPPPVRTPIDVPKPTLITAPPSPAPATFEAPPAPELPAPPAPVVVAAPPAPPVAVAPPPPPPRIPPSEIQYVFRQSPGYPPLSRRRNETGEVLVSFYIDTQGLPQQIVVKRSSGFGLLDEEAVMSVRKSRFKPYSRDGVAMTAAAEIPFLFELENK
jgi:protein TonB